MQPQFNDEGAVPVGVPGDLVLLPLAVLQIELLLYAAAASRNLAELQQSEVSRTQLAQLSFRKNHVSHLDRLRK